MTPVTFTWDGETMVPLPRFARTCDKQFVVGETYPLVVQEERSQATHRHYFAALNEAWKNLPEDLAPRFPTPDSLRKWSLIKCGFADELSIVCDTKADAKRIAAFISRTDPHGVVVVQGCVVSRYVAKSQSSHAMDKATFQESKQAVLDMVAGMIGVTAKALSDEAAKRMPADTGSAMPDGIGNAPAESSQDAAQVAQVAPDRAGKPMAGISPVIEGQAVDAGRPGDGPPVSAAVEGGSGQPSGETRPSEARTAAKPAKKGKGAKPAPPADPPRTESLQRGALSPAAVKGAADRAEAASAARLPAAAVSPPATLAEVKSADGYLAYCRAWIDASDDHRSASERFDVEREDRIRLRLPVKESLLLQNRIDAKFGA